MQRKDVTEVESSNVILKRTLLLEQVGDWQKSVWKWDK